MDRAFLTDLTRTALDGGVPTAQDAERILTDESLELTAIVDAAFEVRRATWGRSVQVHVIDNAANGRCPEDCSYCSQARTSDVDIEEYPMKGIDEILAEAERAHRSGAFRYCLVMSGRGPSTARTAELADAVRRIKEAFPLEVCVSAGLLDDAKAAVLADAGLDRLNHNLNTSEERYGDICTTHTFADRLATLESARRNGLETCSGLIAGMGESTAELVEVAQTLRRIGAESIPVNFLLPFDGTGVGDPVGLSPQFCLRVLCMFRFVNPTAEIRIAAGREVHLRSLEVMALYPANSLFLDGYLNALGSGAARTYTMIRDAGFELSGDRSLDDKLTEIAEIATTPPSPGAASTVDGSTRVQVRAGGLKTLAELRPTR